ncbi:MAG: GNAT family protein [Niabella sp.]
MDNHSIKLETFSEADFDTLISWVKDEKELIQFAGPIFNFPLTKEQLHYYLADPKRHVFKVIHNKTNTVIGHCEVYKGNGQTCRLCRILIGNKIFRGKGYGTLLVKLLTEWSFEKLNVNSVDLNVYDFNTSAIKCYENAGFKRTGINEVTTQVNHETWYSYSMTISREDFYKRLTFRDLN